MTKQLETRPVANHYQPSDQWSFQCAAYSAVAVRSSLQHNWTAQRRSRWPGDSEQWMPKFLQPKEKFAAWWVSSLFLKENDLRHPTASSWIRIWHLTSRMFFSCLVNLWFPTPGTPPLIWAASTKRSQRLAAQRPRCSGRSRCCSLPADSASSIASGPASAWLSMVQRKSLCHWRPAIDHPHDQAKIHEKHAHLGQISKVQELLSSQGHRLAVFPGVKVPDNSIWFMSLRQTNWLTARQSIEVVIKTYQNHISCKAN